MVPATNHPEPAAAVGLPFGVPSRDAPEIAALCRRAILGTLLPISIALLVVYVGLYTYRGLGATPMSAFLACVCGLSYAARRGGHYGLGAGVFLIGTFACLTVYSLGLAGDANGLASGSAYTLCFYPLFAWVCSTARWQRLAITTVTVAALTAVFFAGQRPDQGYSLPEVAFALSYVRALFLIAVSLGIAYGFDLATERSHRRLETALTRQWDLNDRLDRKASELEAAREAQSLAAATASAAHARYRHLFENAFDGIVLYDGVRDEPIEINQPLADKLGYTPEELLGLRPEEVSPTRQRDGRPTAEARAEVRERLAVDASARYPWRHLTADGRALDFEIHTFAIGGDHEARVSMLRDVTEQLRAEDALQAANRELRTFSHAASHDLKEPLRTMSNFAMLLERRYGQTLDERGREYLGFITDAAKRGTTLVNDLLRYAEAGTGDVRLERVDLARVAIQVRSTVEARLAEEGARLDVGALPTITATPTWAQQLLQNLVSNALKFKRPGVPPVVTVEATQTPTHHEIAVADNGIGIAAEHLGRVFGVFERLVGRDQYEGSGIGLALCRRIMDRVGGSIRVDSEVGVGTTFTLSFPKAEGVGSSARAAAETAAKTVVARG